MGKSDLMTENQSGNPDICRIYAASLGLGISSSGSRSGSWVKRMISVEI